MAHYAELDTDEPDIGLLAYDINYTQTAQIGQMQGWLALWDMPQIVVPAAHGVDDRHVVDDGRT